MNSDDFFEYIENVLGPVLEEYAKSKGMTIRELLLEAITLKDTGLFNYKDKQNVVYNRLRKNNITNLKELFTLYDNNNLDYGSDEVIKENNYYIHNEIDGIMTLLKYKYLGIESSRMVELLNYKINNKDNLRDEIYMILKSCGFNQISVNVLIDIMYEKKIDNITLGEFLLSLSLEDINNKFSKIEQELKPFLNILNIIIDYYKNYNKIEMNSNKKY